MKKYIIVSIAALMFRAMTSWAESPPTSYSKDFRCISLANKSEEQQRHLFLELETEVIEQHGWDRIGESDHYNDSIEAACLKSPFSKMGEKIYQYYEVYSNLIDVRSDINE